MTKVVRQPSVYIPHGGGPCFFMNWSKGNIWQGMQGFLESLAEMLPAQPEALLVVSAHWEESDVTLTPVWLLRYCTTIMGFQSILIS